MFLIKVIFNIVLIKITKHFCTIQTPEHMDTRHVVVSSVESTILYKVPSFQVSAFPVCFSFLSLIAYYLILLQGDSQLIIPNLR